MIKDGIQLDAMRKRMLDSIATLQKKSEDSEYSATNYT
jgi:serine/threonine protein kinase